MKTSPARLPSGPIGQKARLLPPSRWLRGKSFSSRTCARISGSRSEEHTSELQSHSDLVCRLLLEKKKLKAHSSFVEVNQLAPIVLTEIGNDQPFDRYPRTSEPLASLFLKIFNCRVYGHIVVYRII